MIHVTTIKLYMYFHECLLFFLYKMRKKCVHKSIMEYAFGILNKSLLYSKLKINVQANLKSRSDNKNTEFVENNPFFVTVWFVVTECVRVSEHIKRTCILCILHSLHFP